MLFTILATRTKYELVYVGVDQRTAGIIITRLDEMSISYELSAGGSNISVPKADVEKVQVALASEIDPSGGNIYSKFWGGFRLIRSIEGISDTNVILKRVQDYSKS